jgi:hypothetical protein
MDNLPETDTIIPPEPKKKSHRTSVWWPLILILVGVILLVQNLHIANFTFQWWALFIFIPVFASLNTAWKSLQNTGRFNSTVRGNLGSAILVGSAAVILMFGMDWGKVWPVMVIAGGLSMFLSGLSSLDPNENHRVTVWMGLAAWIGLGGIVLGVGFLGQYLPIPAIQTWLAAYPKWWAVPIIVAGAGILLNAVILIGRNDWRMNWETWSILLIAVFTAAVGVMAFFTLDWNLLFPVVLIVCGIMIMAGILRKRS